MITDDLFSDTLTGRKLWNIEPFLERVRSDPYALGYRYATAWARGIELSCWDAQGKATGQPVHEFLGGKHRETVPVAFCLGLTSVEEARRKALEAIEPGSGRSPQARTFRWPIIAAMISG